MKKENDLEIDFVNGPIKTVKDQEYGPIKKENDLENDLDNTPI